MYPLTFLLVTLLAGGARCGVLYHRQHAGSITVKGLRAAQGVDKSPSSVAPPQASFPRTPYFGPFTDLPPLADYPVRLIKITRTIAVPVLTHHRGDPAAAYLQLGRPPFAGHYEDAPPTSSSHGPLQNLFPSYDKESLYHKYKQYN